MDATLPEPSLKKPELVREWEKKFTIPLSADIGGIVEKAESLAKANGWEIRPREESRRSVSYFDNPENYIALKRNQTIRQVIRLDGNGNEMGIRYDYKTGMKKRYEATLESPMMLSTEKIFDYMPEGFCEDQDKIFYKALSAVANASTDHIKIKVQRRGVLLEVKFDHFIVENGGAFRELEIELKKKSDRGMAHSRISLDVLSESFGTGLSQYGVFAHDAQKYTHVLASIANARMNWA